MATPTTLTEAKAALQRARSTIKNAKEEAEQIATRGTSLMIGAGTGAALGLLDSKYGDPTAIGQKRARIPGTEIEASTALAFAGGALGVSGLAGKASDQVVAMAIGASAIAAHDFTYERSEAAEEG